MANSKITDKVLDAYNQTIINDLKERFKWLQDESAKIFKKSRANQLAIKKGGSILTADKFKALNQLRKSINREKKNNKRALGALIQNRPKVYKDVILDIINNKLDAEGISKAIKNFQGKAKRLGGIGHYYDPKISKVGHTKVGLNILPEALQDWVQPFDGPTGNKMWTEFQNLARKAKLDVGDEFLNFIDPAAHKPFTTVTTGILAKRFGLDAKSIPEDFLKELHQKQAHSALFGYEAGFKMPKLKELRGVDPEEFFKAAKPYLELPYMGNKVASDLDRVLVNSEGMTTPQLQKAIRDIPIDPKATELAEKLKMFEQNPDLKGRLRIVDGNITASSPITGPVHPGDIKIKNASVKPKGGVLGIIKKGAKTALKGNIAQKIATAPVRAAGTPLGGGEQGEALGNLARTGDKKYLKDLAIASGKDLAIGGAFNVGTIGAKALAQKQFTKGLIKKGLTRVALGSVAGPVGWALLGYSALDTANAFTKAYTGKGLVGHAKDLFIKNQDNPAKGVQIARVVPEKRGGFTRTQWENLKNKLNDPNDPTGNYRTPGGPVFDVNTMQIKGV